MHQKRSAKLPHTCADTTSDAPACRIDGQLDLLSDQCERTCDRKGRREINCTADAWGGGGGLAYNLVPILDDKPVSLWIIINDIHLRQLKGHWFPPSVADTPIVGDAGPGVMAGVVVC